MRIVVLSRQESLYSTRMLVDAGLHRGHDMEVMDTLQFDIRLSRRNPELLYRGEPVGRVDAVIPPIGASITFFGLAVVLNRDDGRLLSQRVAGRRPFATSCALQMLSRHDIGVPPTVYTARPTT